MAVLGGPGGRNRTPPATVCLTIPCWAVGDARPRSARECAGDGPNGRAARSDQVLAVLQARPPVGEEGEEIGDADGAVAVEVGGQLPPIREEDEQIAHADGAVAVEIGWTIAAIEARPPIGQENEKIGHTD